MPIEREGSTSRATTLTGGEQPVQEPLLNQTQQVQQKVQPELTQSSSFNTVNSVLVNQTTEPTATKQVVVGGLSKSAPPPTIKPQPSPVPTSPFIRSERTEVETRQGIFVSKDQLSPEAKAYVESPEVKEYQEKQIESILFYGEQGHIEFGGKYAPVEIPQGQKIGGIEEKITLVPVPVRSGREGSGFRESTSLSISLVPIQPQKTVEPMKSLSESIMGSQPSKETIVKGVGSDPMFVFKQQEKRQKQEFVAGVIATGENVILGGVKTASLLSDFMLVPAPIKFGIKVTEKYGPQPPPTVSGGLIGQGIGVFTGQPSDELSRATKSPSYAFGNIFGDVLLSVGVSELFKLGSPSSAKVTKITGAKEFEITKGTGKSLKSSRVTEYLTKTEKISLSDAKTLKAFERFHIPEQIKLGGTQTRIELYGDDFSRVVNRSAEVTRGVDPILGTIKQASKSKSLGTKVLEKLRLKSGDVGTGGFTKVAEYQGATHTINSYGLATKGGKALVSSSDEIAGVSSKFPFGSAYAKKTFTGVMIEGKIDSQIYFDLMKNVPQSSLWYGQMGGVPQEVAQRTGIKTLNVFTQVTGVQVTSNLASRMLYGTGTVLASKIVNPFSRSSVKQPTQIKSNILTATKPPLTKTVPVHDTIIPRRTPIDFLTTGSRSKTRIVDPILGSKSTIDIKTEEIQKSLPTFPKLNPDFLAGTTQKKQITTPPKTLLTPNPIYERQKQSTPQIISGSQKNNPLRLQVPSITQRPDKTKIKPPLEVTIGKTRIDPFVTHNPIIDSDLKIGGGTTVGPFISNVPKFSLPKIPVAIISPRPVPNFPMPYLPRGGRGKRSVIKNFKGIWTPRKHKVKKHEDVLKDFMNFGSGNKALKGRRTKSKRKPKKKKKKRNKFAVFKI